MVGEKKKKSRHLVPTPSSFESVFPSFIYGTETEPHKWTGGSRSTACAPHRRRGKKLKACQTLKKSK